jgi:hypothetical protein
MVHDRKHFDLLEDRIGEYGRQKHQLHRNRRRAHCDSRAYHTFQRIVRFPGVVSAFHKSCQGLRLVRPNRNREIDIVRRARDTPSGNGNPPMSA